MARNLKSGPLDVVWTLCLGQGKRHRILQLQKKKPQKGGGCRWGENENLRQSNDARGEFENRGLCGGSHYQEEKPGESGVSKLAKPYNKGGRSETARQRIINEGEACIAFRRLKEGERKGVNKLGARVLFHGKKEELNFSLKGERSEKSVGERNRRGKAREEGIHEERFT